MVKWLRPLSNVLEEALKLSSRQSMFVPSKVKGRVLLSENLTSFASVTEIVSPPHRGPPMGM